MTNDLVNGSFEAIGGLLLLMNCWRVYKDRQVSGVSVLPTVFFTTWGVWSLYYYPSLGQWASFTGGTIVVVTNLLWIGLAVYYRRG